MRYEIKYNNNRVHPAIGIYKEFNMLSDAFDYAKELLDTGALFEDIIFVENRPKPCTGEQLKELLLHVGTIDDSFLMEREL